MKSWLDIAKDSDFSLHNIPFGIFKGKGRGPRAATRLGDFVVDLYECSLAGLFHFKGFKAEDFHQDSLNDLISHGKEVTNHIRERIQELFQKGNSEISDNKKLLEDILIPVAEVEMLMPVKVGDYTDFYSSKYHAWNVGSMFRPDNPLLPNWLSLPVAYHGRSSSIVISGTPVKRPVGQFKPADSDRPKFGPTQMLDFELEIAFIIGKQSELGKPVTVHQAEEHIFGFVLFNDWSARDIQSWEYQPLGPFLSKNFLSSISPWIVTLEALDPFRVKGPEPEEKLLPYLETSGLKNFDIKLEVYLKTGDVKPLKITDSNFKYMYWNICQQLAHHTINGCNIRVGDMMASGTISGPDKNSRGCLLELTWRGKEPIQLENGRERRFLEDGDEIIMKAFAEKGEVRVGFGEVRGKVVA